MGSQRASSAEIGGKGGFATNAWRYMRDEWKLIFSMCPIVRWRAYTSLRVEKIFQIGDLRPCWQPTATRIPKSLFTAIVCCAPAGTTGLSPAKLAAADAGASFASGFTLDPSNAPPYRRSIWPKIAARRMPLGRWRQITPFFCKPGNKSLPFRALRRGRPIS